VKTSCPTCGAEIEFRYDDSFVRICDHCRAAVVRSDRGVETLGRVADLTPIDSPLKLFAGGGWNKQTFLLVGMAQIRQATGGISQEWYAKFDDRWGWLAEAQGRYYLTFEYAGVPVPAMQSLRPGTHHGLPVAGELHDFTVGEIGDASYVAAAGELPFRLHAGTTYRFVDLYDGAGGFATIDYGDGSEAPMVYIGRQVTLAEIGVSGGEVGPSTDDKITAQRITCGSCGAPIDLLAAGQTQRVVCAYCNELIDLTTGAAQLLGKLKDKAVLKIPLGTKGTFAEGEMTLIGYLQRVVAIEGSWYSFEEYLLHAPKLGFRWLVCSDGHWSYVQPIAPGAVDYSGTRPKYDGVKFTVFQQPTQIKVDRVFGELYWKVEAGETVTADDYIAPPAMLSRETTGSEENWSLSTYMKPAEVRAAFGNKDLQLDRPTSIGANQPYPVHGFGLSIFFGCIALAIVAIIAAARAREDKRYEHLLTVPKTGAVTPPADATKPTTDAVPDLPPACRDYKAAIDSLAKCDKVTPAARDALATSWTQAEAALREGIPEDRRDAIVQLCTDGRDAIAKLGCGGPEVPAQCKPYEAAIRDLQACDKMKKSDRDPLVAMWNRTKAKFATSPASLAGACAAQAKIVQHAIAKAACKPAGAGSGSASGSGSAGSGSGSGSAEAGSGSAVTVPAEVPPAETPSEPPGYTFFSDPFELDGGSNIEITFRAPGLTNNWIFVATDLVEDASGKVVSFDGNIESYSGVDDGESWSEGDNTANQVIGPLPGGKYILRLEAQHGGGGTENLEVIVRQGIFRARYFALALVVLGIVYLIFGLHAWSFERRRWDQSSFGKAGAPKSPFSFLIIAIAGLFTVIWALVSAIGSSSDD